MHSVICSGLGSLECFVIIKCTKFGQLILRKIIKIVAIRCQILRLKCTKFDFGWGSAPDPAGELTALSRTLTGFKGPTSKGEAKGGEGGEVGEGRQKEGEGGERGRHGKEFPLLWFYNLTTGLPSCQFKLATPFILDLWPGTRQTERQPSTLYARTQWGLGIIIWNSSI